MKPTAIIGRLVDRIYGRDGQHRTLYLLRIKLTPKMRWGGLYLHIFYRGDRDPHPHDHPWDFWTFPLTTYQEEVFFQMLSGGLWQMHTRTVRRFRFHRRPAEYVHRVLDPREGHKIVTLVWHGPKSRSWGFWVDGRWVPWREYVFS